MATDLIKRITKFIKTDIWRVRSSELSRPKSFFLKQLRTIILSFRGFFADKCYLRASALTFYSVLCIVPLLALALAIAAGFGLEEVLQERFLEEFQGHEEVVVRIIDFSHTLLQKAKGGLVAGMGVGMLFLIVIRLLSGIESSFNHIWGVKKSRSFRRKVTDYLAMMLICPLLLIISSGATIFITKHVQLVVQQNAYLEAIAPLILTPLKVLSLCAIWVLFGFIYSFMPNTRVDLISASLGGVVAGTIYQLVQGAYISLQAQVSSYSAVYGSFAALPLFLIWVQISWIIVLLGAEICFAHQNVETYEFEADCLRASYAFKKLLSLRVTHLVVKKFCCGEKPMSATEISAELQIPIRLVRQIVYELLEAGIVSQVGQEGSEEAAYQPARDIGTLTIRDVVAALENRGSKDIPVRQSEELDRLAGYLRTLDEDLEESPANKLLKDI